VVSEEKILEIDQPETRICYGSHVCKQIGTKWAILIDDLPRMFSTTFQFICERGFREEELREMNQNLVGGTYGRFCVKFPQSRTKGERHRLSQLNL
jgi:NAD(P)H-flavin reductase